VTGRGAMGRTAAAAFAAAFLLAALFCAKKMLPPSPDRFAPRLVGVEALSRVRVELEFDEPLDARKLAAESVSVRSAAGSELGILGLSRGRQPQRVVIWTPVQEPVGYEVRGVVWDAAGNPGRFRAGFKGSVRRDTIPPRVARILPAPGATRVRQLTVSVRFSEPVDTAGVSRHLILPAAHETLYHRAWEPDWQEVGFVCRDSVPARTVHYFLLLPGTADLEGNRVRDPAFTYFTPDSSLDAAAVRGRARRSRGPLGTGTVFFADTLTRALAVVLADGTFSGRVPAGVRSVRAVADTNADGLIDLVSPEQEFVTGAESLDLFLAPETLPRPLDAYRR